MLLLYRNLSKESCSYSNVVYIVSAVVAVQNREFSIVVVVTTQVVERSKPVVAPAILERCPESRPLFFSVCLCVSS